MLLSENLVLWCEAQGCAALFVGPARDIVGRTATRNGWRKATTVEALAAGWHRTWDHRGRERWHCPDCRPGGRPLAPVEIPADCPF